MRAAKAARLVGAPSPAAPKHAQMPQWVSAQPAIALNAPQQDRSRQTLERILDATEKIIRTEGVDAVTIPAVARAARSSVGSFYARFPNKAALLQVLHERACEQSIATAQAALDPERWRGVPTRELIHMFMGYVVHLFHERRPMMLAFTSALAGDAGFGERRARTAATIGHLVRALLLERRASMGHPLPQRAVDMTLRFVIATLEQRTTFEASGSPEVAIDDATLIEELTRMALAYLDVRPGA